jgi:hypothetical protein
MKNKMYIFGIVLLILFTIGAIFKMNHLSGAGIVIAVSLILFSLVFCPMALVSAYRAEGKHAFIYVAGGITIAINFAGALFKILHWPGAGIMLTIAIILPFILFLPAYLIYQGRKGARNIRNLILVLFLLVYIAAMDALMALNVSKSVIDDVMLVNDHYTLLAAYYQSSTQDHLSDLDSADLTSGTLLAEKTDHLIAEINQLKEALVIEVSKDNDVAVSKGSGIDIHKVKGNDNRNVSSHVMIGENRALDLKRSINKYKDFLNEITENQQKPFVDKYLNTDDFEWKGEVYSWEEIHFEGAMLIWAINHLSSLEFRVRMVEAEIAGDLALQ